MKKIINISLDTEYIKTSKGNMPYMVGVVVFDNYGYPIEKQGFILAETAKEILDNKEHHKLSSEKMAKSNYQVVDKNDLTLYFQKLLKKYDFTALYAHNIGCDLNALRNYGVYTLDNIKEKRDTQYFCTYNLVKLPTYTKFCKKYGYRTATGCYRVSLEVVGKYLYKDKDYQQNHFSLDDAMMLVDIIKMFKAKKKRLQY